MKPEVAQDYIGFLTHEKQLAKRTIEEYRRELVKYIEWCITTNIVPLEATPHEVRKYVRNLSELGLKSSSVSRAISSMKTFYKWAKLDGHAEQDAAYYLTTPRKAEHLPVYLNEAECETLIGSIGEGSGIAVLQKQVIVLLYLFSGLRARELTGLKLKAIELQQNGDPVRLRVNGKGNKERIIPIPEIVRVPLVRWLNHRKLLHQWNYAKDYKRPMEYVKSEYLIPGIEGGEMVYRAVRNTVVTACEKAGVTVVSPHKLRHTYATNLHRKGVAITVIQSVLGHSSIATTQIYTHVAQNEVEKAIHGAFGG